MVNCYGEPIQFALDLAEMGQPRQLMPSNYTQKIDLVDV
jgi:hypothetical protein